MSAEAATAEPPVNHKRAAAIRLREIADLVDTYKASVESISDLPGDGSHGHRILTIEYHA